MSTFLELQTEVFARGFDYLNDGAAGTTRIKRWINDAYHELCEEADWGFLEADQTGTAPVITTDMRSILSVVDTTSKTELPFVDRRTLADTYADLTTTGTPRFYYIEEGRIVRTYPVGGSLSVHYLKFPADLSANGDTPVVPARYHGLIVDGAVRRALLDRDNPEEAQAVEQHRQVGLAQMKRTLIGQARRAPGRTVFGNNVVPHEPVEAK